ncbi:HNH endonuclease [Ferruginibacter sp. HRS2-29]|uniref:HNH endonuclease n=1 Tax=Ferruginibacter sp. HRS2-29 TaxID=2487334 RepID=UPI0020CC1F4F|nr:HNH endonuclease [Ferruginibacter sp. HRS2-29]MCP9751309.1 HNH endonuclease [Ferruginibacter sp. HRS2-29]
MRNPKWHRDEIILALDLYFSPNRGSIDKKNPKVIEVSKIINKLPIFSIRPDAEKFRNANGVTMKLSNFLKFDETYTGKGMKNTSKLDEEVFKEFVDQRDKLHSIASEIRKVALDENIKLKIYQIEDDEETINDSVMEGQVLYKLHKVRERDKKIVQEKKKQSMIDGKLYCEACEFEYQSKYGELGTGFIECHHKMPLFNIQISRKTRLDDLALVCADCHRMLHRRIDTLSIENLKYILNTTNDGHVNFLK